MTARQMQEQFEASINYFDVPDKKRILSSDVKRFLNESQRSYINRRLEASGLKPDNKQKRVDELRSLIVKNTYLVKNTGLSTSDYQAYALPSNYLHLINDRSTTTYCNRTFNNVDNRQVEGEEIYNILNYSFTKPTYKSPVSHLNGNYLYVYLNSTFNITSVVIDYYRQPVAIDPIALVNCELPESIHDSIVQGAVEIYLEIIDPNRFSTSIQKNIINEQK
jgi:hypothetical protein